MSSSYSIGVFMDHRVKELLDILASSQGTTSEVILGSALRQQIILHKEDLQASMQKRYKTEIDELQNELPKLIEEKNKTEQIYDAKRKERDEKDPESKQWHALDVQFKEIESQYYLLDRELNLLYTRIEDRNRIYEGDLQMLNNITP
jgi:hypothetical protein